MKVLHVIRVTAMAGAEKLLTQLLPSLEKQARMELLILYQGEPAEAVLEIERILLQAGVPVKLERYGSIFSRQLRARIAEMVRAGDYDLIHSHLKHSDLLLASLRFLRIIRIPVVTTVHGYRDQYENRFGFQVSKSLYFTSYYWLTRWIYRQFDGFIFISNIVKKFVTDSGLAAGGARSQVIYHGYTFQESANERAAPGQELQLALPGRLIRRKGQWIAIEAVRILQAQGLKCQLHLYGEGADRELLLAQVQRAGVQDRVFFHGYVREIRQRLSAADIVLLPSVWEGFGIVFLDGFSVNRPVIALDLPAANEIIEDGRNGVLVKGTDPIGLAAAIASLEADPLKRQAIAREAYQDLETRFSMSKMVSAYYSFYQTVLGNVEVH